MREIESWDVESTSSLALSALSVGFCKIFLFFRIGGRPDGLSTASSEGELVDKDKVELSNPGGSSIIVSVNGTVSLVVEYSLILSSWLSENASSIEKSVFFRIK